MDDEYILAKLLKWAEIFYGKRNSKYCFSKKKDDYYLFGFKKRTDKKVNRITKALAIYLCVGLRPKEDEKPVKPTVEKTPEVTTGRKPLRIPRKNQPKVKRFRITE